MRAMNKTRRAFTLTELAIILLLIGFVTAGIWVAVEHVWGNYRVYRVNQQILKTAQNIRDYYGNTIQTWATPGFAANQNITNNLDTLLPNIGIFPPEMRRNPAAAGGATVIDHAMNGNFAGGSFAVLAVTNAATGRLDAFRFQLNGLTTDQCINLLMSAPLTSAELGYVFVSTDAVPAGCAIVKGVCATIAGVTPMALAVARNGCNGATQVNFDFALQN